MRNISYEVVLIEDTIGDLGGIALSFALIALGILMFSVTRSEYKKAKDMWEVYFSYGFFLLGLLITGSGINGIYYFAIHSC